MNNCIFKKEKYVLQWHITHLCNLRCTHCYQEEYARHMEKADFYSALDKFDEYVGGRAVIPQINLTGGEPLLHPDFFEFAKAIHRRNYRLGILTNGTMIDRECAQKLARLSPVFVQISLDGTQKTHDSIRGEGNFKKALDGIDNLKRENVRVLVSFTAQKINYKDYSALAKICRKHNVDKLWWDRIVTSTPDECESSALSTEQFKFIVNKSAAVGRRYEFFHKNIEISNQRALQFLGTHRCGYRCGAGGNLIIFLADGGVMPCRRLPFVIGNIKEKTLSEIIDESEIMQELSKIHIPNECSECEDWNRCYGGAKCVTYAQTGKLFEKDVNCFK